MYSNKISQLTEQVTILTENTVTEGLTCEKYTKCYEARAKIQPLGQIADQKRYLVILPHAPIEFHDIQPAGILWNNTEYAFISHLKPHGGKFLKGIISPSEK